MALDLSLLFEVHKHCQGRRWRRSLIQMSFVGVMRVPRPRDMVKRYGHNLWCETMTGSCKMLKPTMHFSLSWKSDKCSYCHPTDDPCQFSTVVLGLVSAALRTGRKPNAVQERVENLINSQTEHPHAQRNPRRE